MKLPQKKFGWTCLAVGLLGAMTVVGLAARQGMEDILAPGGAGFLLGFGISVLGFQAISRAPGKAAIQIFGKFFFLKLIVLAAGVFAVSQLATGRSAQVFALAFIGGMMLVLLVVAYLHLFSPKGGTDELSSPRSS